MKKRMCGMLLICVLLTLTACSHQEPQIYYAISETGMHTCVEIDGSAYTIAYFIEEEAYHGEYTVEEDGSYMLDMFVVPMRLSPYFGNFYVFTVDEQTDPAVAWLSQKSIIELHDESHFSIYVRYSLRYEFRRDGDRIVVRQVMPDSLTEVWVEGSTVTEYNVISCTCQLRERGQTRMLDLTIGEELYSGTITGNMLTIRIGDAYLELEKIGNDQYFGLLDGAEIFLRMNKDGTAELLEQTGSTTGTVDFVPGKSMQKLTSGLEISLEVDGDQVVMTLDGMEIVHDAVK